MTKSDRSKIENIIGYEFESERLLDAAFTHSSYVNEHAAASNERIEFLGDCVLNFIVGEKLYFDDPKAKEGALSSRRAALVSRAPLARIVDELGLLDFLRVGAGVDKSKFSEKARSDVLEAILGAVYMDGGLSACKAALDKIFYPLVEPERDYKTALQLFSVKSSAALPEYSTVKTDKGFIATVTVLDKRFSGNADTKHGSEIAAAKAALDALGAE